MQHILKCQRCGKYTLSEKCECGGKSVGVIPVRFSVDDRFAKYRRKAKEMMK